MKLDIKMIEAQAEALAPVINRIVTNALKQQRAEMEAEFERRLDSIIASIPDAGEIQKRLEAIESIELPQLPDLSGLITEAGENQIALIEERFEAQDQQLAQAIANIPAPTNGKDGRDGVDGKDGEPGPAGEKGEPGLDGEPGADGRDALQIEILPSIDFDKSFPRGTYALHRGGVMRAYQQTQGEKGWETLLNGVADFNLDMVDNRNIKIHYQLTDGTEKTTTFALPHMIYRGIWKPGVAQVGDTATFGGSLWYCNTDTEEKPGQSEHWTLCAKKGRDGKDLRRGDE